MNYTVTSTRDIHNGQFLDFVKDGNTYNVELSNGEKFITKKFRTIDEATKIYLEIASYFINGLYSFEQRAKLLTNKEL